MLYGKDTSLSVVQDRARAQLAPWSSLGDNSPRLDRRLCSASVRLSAVPALGNGLCARIWGSTSAQRYTNHVVGLERRIGSTMQLHPRTRFVHSCISSPYTTLTTSIPLEITLNNHHGIRSILDRRRHRERRLWHRQHRHDHRQRDRHGTRPAFMRNRAWSHLPLHTDHHHHL
ncbi:hypothetical protein AcW2_000378 [Taiwanofungus camphoratus]|nr:hypothetical protein AcW2_000378 [Antrodia cinnamomea]